MSCYARTATQGGNAAGPFDALSDDELLALVRRLNVDGANAIAPPLPIVANPQGHTPGVRSPWAASPSPWRSADLLPAGDGFGLPAAGGVPSRGGFRRLNILNEERVA